jgi:23S rRNA pseudouridine2604 synthase
MKTDLSKKTTRLNKRMKDLELCGRREADILIDQKRVLVNGKIAKIGQQVADTDLIKIIGKRENYKYILFNKPKNVVSHSPQYGEEEVKNFIPNFEKDKLAIVGRLDKHSEGLMLLTNDKRVIDKVLSPEYYHEKEYIVEVQEKLSSNIVALFKKGFTVRNRFKAKSAEVIINSPFSLNITLTEGKKHQIRLMMNELHYTVGRLKRIRIMSLKLGKIKEGQMKELNKKEIAEFLQSLNLKEI